jgi:murein L,D-transpeptidase YafK
VGNGSAFFLTVLLCSILVVPADCRAGLHQADKVLVLKKERKLFLMKNGEILKSFTVALGRQPVGRKFCQGDCRTPEGTYILDHRNAHSMFYRSIHISYPNGRDIADAKKKGISPGKGVMIHGLPRGFEDLGELHTERDWTKGCLAVTNVEMDEIWRLVPDGTPIEIRP